MPLSLFRFLRVSSHRARSILSRNQVDLELRQEVAFHFDQLVDEFAADGLQRDEAQRAARRAFGNMTLLEEQARDVRRVAWLHDCWHDLGFGLRMLRKNRGFTAVAAASLALGIGANTAVFGVINELLGGGLPFPRTDRLVNIREFPLDNPQRSTNASVPDYFAWQARSRAFEAVGASLPEQKDLRVEPDARAERLSGQGFTPSMFRALGIQPLLGRTFTDAESQIGRAAPVVVISYPLWQRRFAEDPNIVNTRVRLNGVTTTVIGVMPPAFRYPNDNVDYWAPLPLNEAQLQGSARFFMVTARLREGVTVQQAQADVTAVSSQIAAEFPERAGWSARVVPLHDALLGWTRPRLLTFGAAVLLTLLIACTNVAGLLLARGSVRRAEIAVRLALGAGRGRIVRQFLTEGVLLSAIGGVLGVPVAWWGLRGLIAMIPPPGGLRIREIGLTIPMLLATAGLSILTGLLFGLAPALAAFKVDLTGSLKESVRGTGAQSSGHRLRGALVASQIALALVLLIGAGLLLRSFIRLAGRPLNFDPQQVLSFEVRLPTDVYDQSAGMFRGVPYGAARPPVLTMERLYDRLSRIAGAESVAGISLPPVNSLLVPAQTVHVDGRPLPMTDKDRAAAAAKYFLVTPRFFATIRAHLVGGREFEARDNASSPWTAVINETAAHRFWPGENPIGKRFTLDVVSGERPREVVGVVRDIPLRAEFFDDDAVIYTSFLQQSAEYRGPSAGMFSQMTFLLRGPGDSTTLLSEARRAVAAVDPDRALGRVMPLEWYIAGGLRQRAASTLAIGVFALTAVLLAAIGIYGVTAYSVAQRTREVGIRVALGAGVGEIISLIGRSLLWLVSIGLLIGLVISVAFGRLIASQLWGVTPTDPATYAAVSMLLVCVALVACYVPLRRALEVDPTVALRDD